MALSTADPLYPVNTTTVDTAAGIDIRLLDSAQAGATDTSQSCRWLHTNDGVERTFDPATANVTAVAAATSFQGEGWALRLTEDMTPTDDTNCNAVLPAQTVVVQMRCLLNMNGGTGNLGGAENFTMRASLWRYDTSADTGTLIASGSTAQSWDTSALGAENNTYKNTSINVVVASNTEFLANEVLLLQLGALSGTLTNPVTGTTNFDMTLDVDHTDTFVNFAAGRTLIQVCYIQGTGAGVATASGIPVIVLPQIGTSAGSSTVTGALQADANMTGSSSGTSTVSGALQADAQMTGTSAGIATVAGVPAVIVPTTGTVEIGAAGSGGTTVNIMPNFD